MGMTARAAGFLISLVGMAAGAGLVVGGVIDVVVGIGAGLVVAATGGLAAVFLLESTREG